MEILKESNPKESNQIFGRRGLCRPLVLTGLAAQLLGGWQVNAIVTAETGGGPADRPTGAEVHFFS
jgi:hypothetical protein